MLLKTRETYKYLVVSIRAQASTFASDKSIG